MKLVNDPIDVEIGKRMRARRLEIGLTQQTVAQALSVTYQQVQKYEKGAVRIAASKLTILSKLMKVDPSFFYQFTLEPGIPVAFEETSSESVADQDWVRLRLAFTMIKDVSMRQNIVALVQKIAESESSMPCQLSTSA